MNVIEGGKQEGTYRVTLFEDNKLVYPSLWMEVFIVGDAMEQRAFAEMFIRASCTRAVSIEKADLVVFTGGEDVNPALYGEEPHGTTRFNLQRDLDDIQAYKKCLELGIPMFGVCRGAQFLHVMNGGKLYQHVDGHYGDHNIWDLKTKRAIGKTSSVHHQACIPNRDGGMEIIADTMGKSKERWKNKLEKSVGTNADVEAFFYRDTCCFGVQGHPEYKGYNLYMQWTLQQLYDLIGCNPDIELRDGARRLKQSFIEERDARVTNKIKELN